MLFYFFIFSYVLLVAAFFFSVYSLNLLVSCFAFPLFSGVFVADIPRGASKAARSRIRTIEAPARDPNLQGTPPIVCFAHDMHSFLKARTCFSDTVAFTRKSHTCFKKHSRIKTLFE